MKSHPRGITPGPHGTLIVDANQREFLERVHIGPSAVYAGTVRVETFTTLHLCPQSARIMAEALIYFAHRAERLARKNLSPESPTDEPG